MTLKRLLMFIGIATAITACEPPPPPPASPAPPPPPESGRPRTALCPDSDKFLNKVSVLRLPFRPDVYGANYRPPVSAGAIKNPNIRSDLEGAFCAANSKIRTDLLSLNAIYINPCADPNGCASGTPITCDPDNCSLPDDQVIQNSWGYREGRNQFQPGQRLPGRYISTSAGLWKNGQQAPSLNDYETRLVRQLLAWNGPEYMAAGSSTTTVLAALTHELGHVRWYDTFVAVPGSGNHDLKKLCGGSFFDSWKGGWQNVHAPPKWRPFQTLSERRMHPVPDKHRDGLVHITDIDAAITGQNFSLAGPLLGPGAFIAPGIFLTGIYAPAAPWASFFGAISPDEDFIETYKLYALTQATPNLRSLPISIPFVTDMLDIVKDYWANLKPDLSAKIQCIANLPPA